MILRLLLWKRQQKTFKTSFHQFYLNVLSHRGNAQHRVVITGDPQIDPIRVTRTDNALFRTLKLHPFLSEETCVIPVNSWRRRASCAL